ncbi:11206_t:CDS:1 [Paraglomus brasilianum]|uniref:11206_t:CDS:1 n=1 Tax=Paraglomus brasilianum TaxID=144538 RepID=A0A9N8WMY5_9GLOM|nr:11206_t:CDS:1 [Paraglomus brasilianum]
MVINVCRVQLSSPEDRWYWFSFFLLIAIYPTALVGSIIDLGRQFYPSDEWNNHLFKIAVGTLTAFDIANLIFAGLTATDKLPVPFIYAATITIVDICAGVLAFVYAFFPVMTVRTQNNKRRVNASTAAVGVWYTAVIGTMALVYIIVFSVILALGGPEGKTWYIGFAFDSIIRSITTLAVALPPPKTVIPALKNRIFGRGMMSLAIRERGVVSTGIIVEV